MQKIREYLSSDRWNNYKSKDNIIIRYQKEANNNFETVFSTC